MQTYETTIAIKVTQIKSGKTNVRIRREREKNLVELTVDNSMFQTREVTSFCNMKLNCQTSLMKPQNEKSHPRKHDLSQGSDSNFCQFYGTGSPFNLSKPLWSALGREGKGIWREDEGWPLEFFD